MLKTKDEKRKKYLSDYAKRPDQVRKRKLYRDKNKDKARNYYLENQEKLKKYREEYYFKNKKSIIEKAKKYVEKNKEKKLNYWKEFYQKNKKFKLSEAKRRRIEDGEKIRARARELYSIDPARFRKVARKSYLKNIDKVRERNKIYNQKNKEKRYLKHKEWVEKNRDKLNEYIKKIRSTPEGKIAHSLRNRIRLAVKGQGAKKAKTTFNLVGCSLNYLREYIENKFEPGMTWENYGLETWHLDHIKPVSKFNLLDVDEQKKCFHYTNLQPLWAKDNIKKSNKF